MSTVEFVKLFKSKASGLWTGEPIKTGKCKFNKKAKIRLAIRAGLLSKDKKTRTVFHSVHAAHASDEEKRIFYQHCVKKAFDASGKLKKEYTCSATKPKLPTVKPCFRTFVKMMWEPMYSAKEAFSYMLAVS